MIERVRQIRWTIILKGDNVKREQMKGENEVIMKRGKGEEEESV